MDFRLLNRYIKVNLRAKQNLNNQKTQNRTFLKKLSKKMEIKFKIN